MTTTRAATTLLSMVLLLGSVACGSAPVAMAAEQQPGWVMVPPTEMRQSGTLAHPRLAESSGAAVTPRLPGALWTVSDGGNPTELHLIDTTGALARLPGGIEVRTFERPHRGYAQYAVCSRLPV